MRTIFFLASVLACTAVFSQGKTYDSVLAKKLGADDYGMKQYVMVLLKPGPVKITDTAQRARLMQGHLGNILRLSREGKLLIAGPFLDGGSLSGIFIFDVRSIDEARTLVATDPAVKAGVFDAEYHPWYGSAALMQIRDLHTAVQKKSFVN